MVIKKKKGNTLVEIIAAAAIIIMGLQAVTFAFSSSSKMWQSDDKKLDTTVINQSICDLIRYESRVDVKKLYLKRASVGETIGFYIYFDMVGTDPGTSAAKQAADKPYTIEYQFDEERDKGYIGTTFTYDNLKAFDFKTCNEHNGNKQKFAALITIKDERGVDMHMPLYKINVTVWNMQDGGKGASKESFYFGGR